MKEKKLIVNADDFGQSEGINKGIIHAHENGIVTSASLMVRYPAAYSGAKYAGQNNSLSVGLHIDLGEWIFSGENWVPLYEVVSLEDEMEIEKEIRRQLENFYRIMKQTPTHIDSHQHVHLRENIRPIVVAIARELDVPVRRCGTNINYCGSFYGQSTDGFSFHHAISTKSLKEILSQLPEGITEMACHPALYCDVETMYKEERLQEVKTLCDDEIKQTIAEKNIQLCSFAEITQGQIF